MSQLIEICQSFEQPKDASEMSEHLNQLISDYHSKCTLISQRSCPRIKSIMALNVDQLFDKFTDSNWAHHFIFGSRGTGKTTLANEIVSNIWETSTKSNCLRACYSPNTNNQLPSSMYPIRYTGPFPRAMKQIRKFVKSLDTDEADFVALLELDSWNQNESDTNRLIRFENNPEWESTSFVATIQRPDPHFIQKYLDGCSNLMLYFHKSISDDALESIYPYLPHDGQLFDSASEFIDFIKRMESRTFLVYSQIDETFDVVKTSIVEDEAN